MTPSSTPTHVLNVEDAVEIATSESAGCALTSTDQLWCWGNERPCETAEGKACGEFPWNPILVPYFGTTP